MQLHPLPSGEGGERRRPQEDAVADTADLEDDVGAADLGDDAVEGRDHARAALSGVTAWAVQTATARASAASSGRGSSLHRKHQLDHALDLVLGRPAVAGDRELDLVCGRTRSTGNPCCAATSRTTPRAWPTAMAVCTFLLKKSRSTPDRLGPMRRR